jgi:hypothetical protein
MKTIPIAVVEQDRTTSRIPDRRELHGSRTAKGEVQAARFIVSYEDSFVNLEYAQQKLLAVADRLLNEAAHVGERRKRESAINHDEREVCGQ